MWKPVYLFKHGSKRAVHAIVETLATATGCAPVVANPEVQKSPVPGPGGHVIIGATMTDRMLWGKLHELVGAIARQPGRATILVETRSARVLRLLRSRGAPSLLDWSNEDHDELRTALAFSRDGKTYVSQTCLTVMQDRRHPWPEHILTRMEERMLVVLGCGASDAEAADRLGVAEGTAARHRANVMTKLSVHKQADLMKASVAHGYCMIEPDGTYAPGLVAALLASEDKARTDAQARRLNPSSTPRGRRRR